MAREYIIVPAVGWRSERMADFLDKLPITDIIRRGSGNVTAAAASLRAAGRAVRSAPYTVIKSVDENGPKLVSMDPAIARLLRANSPDTIVEPNFRVIAAVRVAARVARHQAWHVTAPVDASGKRLKHRITVRVRDSRGGLVVGARVLALADAERDVGIVRRTGTRGTATFDLPIEVGDLPRLCVEPPAGFHGVTMVDTQIAADGGIEVTLRPVDPSTQIDALRRWAKDLPEDAGKGVRIAVIDSGVNANHPDLRHVSCRAIGEIGQAAPDSGPPHPHATQVAGIIGARGATFRGLATAAELTSIRVTALGAMECGAFDLGTGIEFAAREGDVHLINISMTSDLPSGYLSRAAGTAFHNGAVCVAAAGNEGRNGVSYPAANKWILAVSAFADRSVLAKDAVELRDVGTVVSLSDENMSRARFSNWGPDLDFIGPGVGIISCYGDKGYAADSGTSFAAPSITGLAAAVLARDHGDLLAMPKGPRRATAIVQALLARGFDLGFAPNTQGVGMLNA